MFKLLIICKGVRKVEESKERREREKKKGITGLDFGMIIRPSVS